MNLQFPVSRVLRSSDYAELGDELQFVDQVQSWAGQPHPHQHPHRRWEYALALRTLLLWGSQPGMRMADFGCGIGLMSPMLLAMLHEVTMYEVWVYGNEEEFALRQMINVKQRVDSYASYRMIHRPLCELTDEDRNYDAAFCISTLEHIGEWKRAFLDLLQSVRRGGLVFLTMDYAPKGKNEDYQLAWMRTKIYTPEAMDDIISVAGENGFRLLNGKDWTWEGNMVNDYGFVACAFLREESVLI